MTIRKLSYAAMTGAIALATAAMISPSLAHGPDGYGQQGMGGQGYGHMGGQGMMGSQGYGHMGQMGHMGGQGYGHMGGQGMMGSGGYGHMGNQGPGMFGDCPGKDVDLKLGVEDVGKFVEGMLVMHRGGDLKLGKVEASGETTITAEIVSADGSVVHKIEFDRRTGAHRPVK